MGLTPCGAGLVTLNYELNLNDSIPVEVKNPLPGETEPIRLIKRQRLQWQGDCTIPTDGGVFVTKSLKTDEGTAIEYFVVLQIAPTGSSDKSKNP